MSKTNTEPMQPDTQASESLKLDCYDKQKYQYRCNRYHGQ